MATIRLENLHKSFDDFVAVRNSNLTIESGSFFVLLGPSGCGKTTTLRMIAGLEMPSSGRILLDDEDVTFLRAAKRDIAFVFQLFALYPHMNVRKNLAYPLKCQGMAKPEIEARIAEVASLLRIEGILDHSVGRLAGGDRQRVALGRAIVRRPKAFLMDEPLGTLDAEFRDLMREELCQLHDRIGATTVYVTHDQVEAMSMGDGIAVMNGGEILQAGTPDEIYFTPASMFVAGFIGSPPMNFLAGQGPLAPDSGDLRVNGAAVPIPQLADGIGHETVVLGARPEHVRLADDGPLRGSVYGIEYMGARQILTVDTTAGRMRVRAPHDARVAVGETVGLAFQTDALVVFDGASERAVARRPQEVGHG